LLDGDVTGLSVC